MVKTKEQVAEEHGYERMEGYCFDACRAEDEMATFVEKNEVEAVVAQGPKVYWWNELHEQLYDLDYVLESIYDDAPDDGSTFEQWLERVLNE